MPEETNRNIVITYSADIGEARRTAREMALDTGFDELASQEIAIAVTELASNLLNHAGGGSLKMGPREESGRVGFQVETRDRGPGIPDPELAAEDGYSTRGSLGYGLGSVNRLMDEFDIRSIPEGGTQVVCTRWLRPKEPAGANFPLDFGAATRPHLGMAVNGDAFVIKRWRANLLAGVIDGLGHGKWAHRAASAARNYVERHFHQPLKDIFRGVGIACRATRGVVMALAHIDLEEMVLNFGSVGNIDARIFGSAEHKSFIVRRGVIGFNAPSPVVTSHPWNDGCILVVHSDGLKPHWKREDFPGLFEEPAAVIANKLMKDLGKHNDDSTVVVVRSKL